MKLHELSPAPGSNKAMFTQRQRCWFRQRQNSRQRPQGPEGLSGGGVRPGFEGGQMPLQRRIPREALQNIFAKQYAAINVSALERFEDGATVDAGQSSRLELKKPLDGIKVLGNGELTKKLTVNVAAFSASAKQKIEAGGRKS